MSERPTPEVNVCRLVYHEKISGYSDESYDALRKLAEQLHQERDDARELARELRDALKLLVNNGHSEGCALLHYAIANCDCGVASANSLITKAKEAGL